MWIAGIGAVLAMSIGTALAISILALCAVYARDTATRFMTVSHVRMELMGYGFGLAGGLFIFLLGVLLLQAAQAPAHPLFR